MYTTKGALGSTEHLSSFLALQLSSSKGTRRIDTRLVFILQGEEDRLDYYVIEGE